MVNKIRKKDGSLKYPYKLVLPFEDVNALILELRGCKDIRWVSRYSIVYGIRLHVRCQHNTIPEEVITILGGYGVKYFIDTYHGNTLCVYTYIAYSEFDKEV